MTLSAMDDAGTPVDWWFMYKVAGKGKTSAGGHVLGTDYVYFDANTPADGKLVLSADQVDTSGSLPSTLDRSMGRTPRPARS